MDFAVAVLIASEAYPIKLACRGDLNLDEFGKSVYDRSAHAVQTARIAVGFVIEFTSGVELGIDDLNARDMELFMYTDGYTPAVILNSYGIILIYRDAYFRSIAVCRLVNCIIDYLPEHMVKPPAASAAYIHAGTHAHRFEPLHYPNIIDCVVMLHSHSPCPLHSEFFIHAFELLTDGLYLIIELIWLVPFADELLFVRIEPFKLHPCILKP